MVFKERDKPLKDEIMANVKIKDSIDKLISDEKMTDNKKARDAIFLVIQASYDQGYHDARSHYNIDSPDPEPVEVI